MKQWVSVVKRKRSPFINYFYFEGLSKLYNPIEDYDYRYQGDWIYVNDEYFLEKKVFLKSVKQITNKIEKDNKFLLNVTVKAYKEIKEHVKIWEKIKNTDVSKLSNKKLAKLLEEYTLSLLKWNAYLHLPTTSEPIITKILEKSLKKLIKDEKEYRRYFMIFTTTTKKSFALEENISLLKIVKKIQESKDYPKKMIEEHLEEFSWINNVGFWNEFIDYKEIIKKIKEMMPINSKERLNEIEEVIKENEKEYKKAIEELNPSEDLLTLIKTIREYVYFRSFRMEIMYKSGYYIQNLLDEIAKRIGIDKKDVIYFMPDELVDFLKENKINKKLISERKKGFACTCEDYKLKVYSGDELKEFHKKYIIKIKEESKEITGACASPGIVEGIVRIVNSKKDINKIKEGDILVMTMTTPDFVPAMKKAGAIVTDEGGILCHAAIVSRELGVPCMIGTKVATKVLKDGDFIRVDASHGILKIFKKL